MRTIIFILNLIWLATAFADDATLPLGKPYENSEHHYRISFPANWTFVKPNESFTQVKVRAPQGYAAMSVAHRFGLWRADTNSMWYDDSWKALDGISLATFTNRFERDVPAETAVILTVEKVTLGKEKAVKVDYVITDSTKKVSARIRSFFILRANYWYVVFCSTSESQPDLFLDVMLKAANTFDVYAPKPLWQYP